MTPIIIFSLGLYEEFLTHAKMDSKLRDMIKYKHMCLYQSKTFYNVRQTTSHRFLDQGKNC